MPETVEEIPLDAIFVNNEFNCRGAIAPMDVIELSRSIEKLGLQAPIVLSEMDDTEKVTHPPYRYKLIAGFRRMMAHKVLKWDKIKAIVKPPMSDLQARLINLTENLDRQALNILQEAHALKVLVDLGLKREEIAERLGQSIGWVQVRMMLLTFPDDIQREAAAGMLGQHQIRDLYAMRGNPDEMYAAVRQIKDARSRNEKGVRVRPKAETPLKKRKRDATEIYKAINLLMDTFKQTTLASRALAWANGEITDLDLYEEIAIRAKEAGISFAVPAVSITNLYSS